MSVACNASLLPPFIWACLFQAPFCKHYNLLGLFCPTLCLFSVCSLPYIPIWALTYSKVTASILSLSCLLLTSWISKVRSLVLAIPIMPGFFNPAIATLESVRIMTFVSCDGYLSAQRTPVPSLSQPVVSFSRLFSPPILACWIPYSGPTTPSSCILPLINTENPPSIASWMAGYHSSLVFSSLYLSFSSGTWVARTFPPRLNFTLLLSARVSCFSISLLINVCYLSLSFCSKSLYLDGSCIPLPNRRPWLVSRIILTNSTLAIAFALCIHVDKWVQCIFLVPGIEVASIVFPSLFVPFNQLWSP